MSSVDYDLVTVGGGMGGATLAASMAARGYRVLVVERERVFRDRVRGEALAPWGSGIARELGVDRVLAGAGAHQLRWWNIFAGGAQIMSRDVPATTPQQTGWTTAFHPAMQDALLAFASAAGADVWRPAQVADVQGGVVPRVTIQRDGTTLDVSARLVVGADGRGSATRRFGGFPTEQDPPRLLFAGVLLDGVACPDDEFTHVAAPGHGLLAYVFPQGGGRARVYLGFHERLGLPRLSGEAAFPRFRELSEQIGLPPSYYAAARVAGPLATFDGADSWVPHPYANGIALIGDAAATSDPTWGQGMSLALCDVRALRDALIASSDWDAAGHTYAAEHARHYGILHRVDGWYGDVFMEIGPAADARRARALPGIIADPTRLPEPPVSGPESPHGDDVRRRFFGEV